MTHALSASAWNESAHPRSPAGQSGGGEFSGGSGSKTSKPAAPTRHHIVIPKGQLGFDGTRGTGYGTPGGDDRVKRLQEDLNRLGLTDSRGRKLAVDGRLGPLTTQSIKAAQERLGMKPTGIVTEGFIARLDAARALPKDTTKAPHKAPTKTAASDAPPPAPAVAAASAPDLCGVELARPGDWKLSTGPVTFTDRHLRDAADFFAASGGQAVPVKLGHVDDRFDGEPTFGSVTNVRYAVDDRGPVLLGDIVDMPGWLSAAAPKRWPNRSIEGWQNFTYDGREYSLVLSGLAFLGVTPPAVRNIRSLSDLQTALAASSALRLVASAPVDDAAVSPQTPAPAAEGPREGTGMDPVKIREALGLDPDASDEEMTAALIAAAGVTPQSAPPPEPVQASLFAEPAAPKPAAAKKEPANAAGSWMRVEASAWEAAQDRIQRLEAQAQKQRVAERDQIIAKAVVDGKFTPARKEHWVRLWDADPEGTREVIDGLARNVVPVMAAGYAGDDNEDLDAEYAHLFPPTRKEVSRG